jgi:hypothetical protein|tara:strand:- start:66 stop:569 length:504 start_codon:yes stop_codon:yes gene_type:complete
MQDFIYRNLISHIDINRDAIEYLNFDDISKDVKFDEFIDDMHKDNDTIELNLIKNKAYREAVVMPLHIKNSESAFLREIIKDEQKTFGGSKLFYINETNNKILVVAVPKSMDGKLHMTINKLNKINERISRLNAKIKKGNTEMYMKRKSVNDKKDDVVNMVNKNLKV